MNNSEFLIVAVCICILTVMASIKLRHGCSLPGIMPRILCAPYLVHALYHTVAKLSSAHMFPHAIATSSQPSHELATLAFHINILENILVRRHLTRLYTFTSRLLRGNTLEHPHTGGNFWFFVAYTPKCQNTLCSWLSMRVVCWPSWLHSYLQTPSPPPFDTSAPFKIFGFGFAGGFTNSHKLLPILHTPNYLIFFLFHMRNPATKKKTTTTRRI